MVAVAPGKLVPLFDEARGLASLDAAIGFVRAQDGTHGGLVRGLLAPDRVETCTAALLRRTMAAAEALDVPVRLHCAQGQMERDTVAALHGSTAPAWLAALGVLGPRLIAPHATFATDADLALYRDHGVTIAHCPLVFARSGVVLRSFRRCRDLGVRIGMGTDTAPPDMVLNMAVGVMACRIAEGDPLAVSAGEMFDAATLGGANALRRPDLGRLAPGSKADIAVFDLADPMIAPTIDPIQSLVLGATGRVTRAVFVDGRLSMWGGRVAGIDMDSARARAQAQFDRLVAKYPERTWGHPPVGEIFPLTYPRLAGS